MEVLAPLKLLALPIIVIDVFIIALAARAFVRVAREIGVIRTLLLCIGGSILVSFGGEAIGFHVKSHGFMAALPVNVIAAALPLFIYGYLPKALTKKRSLFRSSEQVASTTHPRKEDGLE